MVPFGDVVNPLYVVGAPLDKYPDLLARLSSGEVVRSGGVFRMATGLPGAGSIVAHARQVGSLARAPAALTASMGLSAIGAAASVATLGVSIAGFWIMNKRLLRIQGDIDGMRTEVLGKVDGLHTVLRRVETRLIASAAAIRDDVKELAGEFRRLRVAIHQREFARIQGVLDGLARRSRGSGGPEETDLKHAENVLAEVIPWLQARITSAQEAREGAPGVEQIVFVQWYTVAVVAEAAVLFHQYSPAEASIQVSQRLDRVKRALAEMGHQALPVHLLEEGQLRKMSDYLGPALMQAIRDEEHAAALPVGNRRGTRLHKIPAPDLQHRGLVAASVYGCAAELEALSAELGEGAPAITDPLAEWRQDPADSTPSPLLVKRISEPAER